MLRSTSRDRARGAHEAAPDPGGPTLGQAVPVLPDRAGEAPSDVTYRRVMSRRELAVFVVLLGVALFLTARYAAWWFHTDNVPVNRSGGRWWIDALANYGPFIALSSLEALRVLQMAALWVFALSMRSAVRMAAPTGLRVAVLTTIVPSKEPVSILEQTLPAMKGIRYPEPFDVWVLDEEDDPEVRALCARWGAHHFSRHGVERYNQPSGFFKARTKAGNHNAWRDQHAAEYDVVAQMDPDHIPTEDFLEKTLGYFRDPDVGFVVAPQVYYRNTDSSWIARGADEANFGFSAITQRGANLLGMPIFIGSNHLCRSRALDSVGGYASHIVEDHLTGMEMLATENPRTGNHWKGVYTEEIISLGEGPTRWSSYLSQQLRWAYGLVTIVLHDSARLLRRMRPQQAFGYVLIQSYYISVAVILTIGLTLTTAHLVFGVNAISVPFDEWLSIWFPQLAFSIMIWYWLQRFYLRETDRGWGVRGILVSLGAMVTYTQALALAVFRKPLSYVITPKGEVGAREPLRLFRWQLVSLLVSMGALGWAAWHSTGAMTIKFWAVLNVVQMGFVIGTGVAVPGVLRTSLSWKWSEALAHYWVRIAVPAVSGVAALALATQIATLGTAPAAGDQTVPPSDIPTLGPAAPAAPVLASFLRPRSDAVAFGGFDLGGKLASDALVRHEFVDFGPGSTERLQQAVVTAAGADQIAMLSWETKLAGRPAQSRYLLDQVASGQLDRYVAGVAAALRDTQQRVILRFDAEMDQKTDELHPWSGRPPAIFIAAWRRVHRIFQQQHATNVLFAWTPGGYFVDGVFASDEWYPGDAYVDVVGFSAYAFWGWEEWDQERAATHAFRSPRELIVPRYDALRAHGKPVILAEVGIALHPTRRDEQTPWLRDLVDLVDHDLPDVSALVYFYSPHNFDDFDIDWRLTRAERLAFAKRLERSDRIEAPGVSP